MRQKVHFLGLLGIAIMCAQTLVAQNVTLPYFQGFEVTDAAENAEWVLNPGGTTAAYANADHWVIGSSVRSGGRQALYITNGDPTATNPVAGMGARPNIQYVYRDILLPQGNYTVSFDWMCVGSPNAELYAGYVTTNVNLTASTSATALPTNVQSGVKNGTNGQNGASVPVKLNNQPTWQTASFVLSSNGTRTARVFFAWRNNNTDSTQVGNFGACIDNVQITNNLAQAPTSLNVEVVSCDSVHVTWTGTSSEYDLEYRKQGSTAWIVESGIPNTGTQNEWWLNMTEEAAYDFRVRGTIYTADGTSYVSAYRTLDNEVVFCPDLHCINYVNLRDEDVVICEYGHEGYDYTSTKANPNFQRGVIDQGPESMASRHTVVWDRTATDPRTNGQLPMVAPGEFASVRLGNWNSGAEMERMTYNFVVDSINCVMLLKYAVVEEDPDHGPNEQPRFTVEFLDMYGNLIDPICGQRDFYAGDPAETNWHTVGSGYDAVKWKDWSTMGFNLSDYIGETVQIRVTNYDCFQSGHYGYCYFTLGCAEGQITINSCGDAESPKATAPEGFNYQWYYLSDPDVILSTTREFYPQDTAAFACRMQYQGMGDCYCVLTSAIHARYPEVDFAWSYEPSDCKNTVKFTNNSYIRTLIQDEWVHLDQRLDEYEWEFTDMQGNLIKRVSTTNPSVDFPQDGGFYKATLIGYLSDRQCVDDTTLTILLPKIGNTVTEIDTTLCYRGYIQWGEQVAATTGTYTHEMKSIAGCDSIEIVHLTVLPNFDVTLPDTTVCFAPQGQVYSIDGDVYPYQDSREWVRYKTSPEGCNYVIVQQVNVTDEIIENVSVVQMSEEVETATITIHDATGAGYTYYTINGERHEAGSGDFVLTTEEPGDYQILFYNDHGCVVEENYYLEAPCLRNLIYQRWDDVLSLKNEQYGGLDYVAFQWYKDDILIPGETKSYLYVPEGLDLNASYSVFVWLQDSTQNNMTCPFHPHAYTGTIIVSNTQAHVGGDVFVTAPKTAHIECYTAMGQLVATGVAEAQETTPFRMPSAAGFYLLKVTTADDSRAFRIRVTD